MVLLPLPPFPRIPILLSASGLSVVFVPSPSLRRPPERYALALHTRTTCDYSKTLSLLTFHLTNVDRLAHAVVHEMCSVLLFERLYGSVTGAV